MNISELNELIQLEKNKKNISVKEISDGHHSFDELYRNRMILFCTLCNCFPDISWKSKKHYNEETDPMFNGDFIAGINTPKGVATYHFKIKYWDLFKVKELDRALPYDDYSNDEVMVRIMSLGPNNTKKRYK